MKIVETLPGVHLQTSRVKTLDSLLEKVINKRHKHLMDVKNLYSGITGSNYKDILTDLVGIRLIISYRGKWLDIHNAIIKKFPYSSDMNLYNIYKYLPHPKSGEGIIAEMPKAYYAYGDDISMYEAAGIRWEIRENGYRSVHYIISFQKTYIEIQTRTIYDEAWSDCDHSYVYKHEENASHSALEELSQILCKLTNISNDLGEEMRVIFESELIREIDEIYVADDNVKLQIKQILDRISETKKQLEIFGEEIGVRSESYGGI